MEGTLLPFMAACVALLRGAVEWRRRPRGAGGLLFQYAALAAVNAGLLWRGVEDPGWQWAAAAPVLVLWLVPPLLESWAGTQLRIGRPAPMRWMLTLRALLAWHRRHWMDVLYLPARLFRAAGRHDRAVEVARRLQGAAPLRGLEIDQAQELAACLVAAERWQELLAEPSILDAAEQHGPAAVAVAVARAERGDQIGAAEALRRARELRAPDLQWRLAWARVLAAAGRGAELTRWLGAAGLLEQQAIAPIVARILRRAQEPPAGVAELPPVPPFDELEKADLAAELEQRLVRGGRGSKVCFWAVAIAWLLQVAMGGLNDPGVPAAWGAVMPPLLWAGQWWRAVATTLLHGAWLHFIFNAMAIMVIAPRVEAIIGGRLLMLAWVFTALGGALGSAWNGVPMSVGASGAILGLCGVYVVILLRKPPGVPESVGRGQAGLMALLVGLSLSYGLFEPMIDNGGHLGGLAAGVLLGLVLPPAALRPVPLGAGWLMAAAVASSAGLLSVAVMAMAIVTGGELRPSQVSTRREAGPYATNLALPDWWETDADAKWTWRAPPGGLHFHLWAEGVAESTLSTEVEDIIRRETQHADDVRLVGQVRLASGVERVDIRLRRRADDGGPAMDLVIAVYEARRRGSKQATMAYAEATPGFMAFYRAILDDLVAQATPPE